MPFAAANIKVPHRDKTPQIIMKWFLIGPVISLINFIGVNYKHLIACLHIMETLGGTSYNVRVLPILQRPSVIDCNSKLVKRLTITMINHSVNL